MENFAEFVRGFCVIAVSGGLVMLVSPGGKLQKHVKFIISLCMVCALLSAFLSFSENAEKIFAEIESEASEGAGEAEEELCREVAKRAKKNMEEELCALLSAHLGLEREGIYVVAALDTGNLSAVEITEINVFLCDVSRAEEARAYLSEMFMGAVKINVMKKGE